MQSEYTLWRLTAFVKDSLKGQARNPGGISGSGNNNDNNDDNKKSSSKRKREICDALAKTAVKRTKKLSSLWPAIAACSSLMLFGCIACEFE